MIIYRLKYSSLIGIAVCLFVLAGCNNKDKKGDSIAGTPQELQEKVTALIQRFTEQATWDNTKSYDSVLFNQPRLTILLYKTKSFEPLWSKTEEWLPAGDSLFNFIESSQLFGLFPEDYHVKGLKEIRQKFFADSLAKSDKKRCCSMV